MGSDAAVYPFDYERYRDHVVPAIKRYLLHGETTTWLQALIAKTGYQLPGVNGTDLDRHCHTLRADLAWDAPYDTADTWFEDWPVRACKSTTCPDLNRCPYHDHLQGSVAETLNCLIEGAIAGLCLHEERFVGRTMRVIKYWDLLTQYGVPEDDPLRGLLLNLGKRGFVVGYQWTLDGNGTHGWLNPAETQDLAERLLRLPLPQFPATFEAMKQAYKAFVATAEAQLDPGDFRALSLAFVRTVAIIAVDRKQGILWGNDIINYPGYLPENLTVDE